MSKAIQLAECAEKSASAFDEVIVDGGRLLWEIAAELRRLARIEAGRQPALDQILKNAFCDGTAAMLVSAEGIKALSKEDLYLRPSAVELQDAEIGMPEPVTELINPVQSI